MDLEKSKSITNDIRTTCERIHLLCHYTAIVLRRLRGELDHEKPHKSE